MSSRTIRLVPKLSIAGIKARLDRKLALWYCLRARNHRGSGRLDLENATDALVYLFGFSTSIAYRVLAGDDGLFWAKRLMRNINSLQVEIYGVKRSTRYSDTLPAVVSSKFRLLILCAKRGRG